MAVQLKPAVDRVLSRCTETPSGCWLFGGAKTRGGYGVVGLGGRDAGNRVAHRVTYEAFVGEIPEGLDLDHLCRNRACVNPWHLDPVTRVVNVARGDRAPGYAVRARKECPHGHPYTPENTIQLATQRLCRTCTNARRRARRAAQRTIERNAA